MKKSNIMLTGAAALVALTAVAGMSLSAFAGNNSSDNAFSQGRTPQGINLTDEQRTQMHDAMEAKMEELGIDTSDMEDRWANREDRWADREARREAVQAALDAGNYDNFAAAIGDNSPFNGKINKDNFGRLVEAHNLMESGRKIMEELGVKTGMGRHGEGQGHRGMWK